jgi:hypothetical protein
VRAAFSTPRPVPARTAPVVASGAVVGFALPVFALAGWNLKGWGLAAVLWGGSQLFAALLLTRLRPGADRLAASGVLAFGMMFRGVGVMIVVFAVAVAQPRLALAAALVYALAYTVELGLSLVTYFGSET